jgi:glycosyltransferase involved in cell wall biosynthesis
MACATPVVVSRVGGMHHVVDDGATGYLVPPSDPQALGERLRRLLDDPAGARRMGEAARRRIEDLFTWDHVARRCLEAYRL